MSADVQERLLAVLGHHRVRGNCIGMAELYRKVYRLPCDHRINDTTALRVLIRRLRMEGHPICSIPDRYDPGYWLAEDAQDLDEFIGRHERRGLTSLAQAAKLRKIALPELLGQLKLAEEVRP
jgi:hypothetical protein